MIFVTGLPLSVRVMELLYSGPAGHNIIRYELWKSDAEYPEGIRLPRDFDLDTILEPQALSGIRAHRVLVPVWDPALAGSLSKVGCEAWSHTIDGGQA